MRDILITAFVFGLVPFILYKPVLGAYAWAWLGMMNPHRAAFGFARTMPFAQTVALATLVGMLFSKRRKRFPLDAISTTMVALLLWMTVTTLFAINPLTEIVWDRWLFVLKIQVMLFATMMLVRGRTEIERLIWVITLSIGFYGIKGGVWTVLTGGAGRVWGPPGGFIEGNNELAVALTMLIPMMYFLYQVSTRRWLRWAMLFGIAMTAFAILGSQSRGALLSLVAMAGFMGLKGKYPVRTSLLLVLGLALAIGFMPESWTHRMDTIQGYETDTSAMSRLYTWTTLWNCAVDRPLVGAGFMADTVHVFMRYAPRTAEFGAYFDQVYVAHSIYFQMLGEHGFPGLLLFLMLGGFTWRTAGRLARQTRGDPELGHWVPLLMPMVQVSLIGYAVGGAFLSLGYFDLPYYIMAIVSLTQATLNERRRGGVSDAAPPESRAAEHPQSFPP